MPTINPDLPVINIAPLINNTVDTTAVAAAINYACTNFGFFYITGHNIQPELIQRLENLSHQFFNQPEAWKMQWSMDKGGRAWRGYFPAGNELTSSRPDWKEGLYLGTELAPEHPLVQAQTPMHGQNLFPEINGFKETILEYMAAVSQLGHLLLKGISLSLGLPEQYFAKHYTADPLILFRLFNYPSRSIPADLDVRWGVGEHTDYGLLTILHQDKIGGLEVHTPQGWISAPPIDGTFVCNIGDMLDYISGGLYKSTPHRVRVNTSGQNRLSFPLFFDPNFNAKIKRIANLPGSLALDDSRQRWDKTNIHDFKGTYGEYLLAKVARVFPELGKTAL